MLVIPVIDIKDGRCMRLFHGHYETTNFYSDNPVKIARLFRKENFKCLHITDLDGAVQGEMKNYPVIKEICKSVDIPVQLGGGIRDFETAKKIIEELGIYRIVVGTAAISNPDMIKRILDEYTASKIVIGIDEKLNNVVTNGWINYANITPLEFAKMMENIGIRRIIYQDVTRVGNCTGPFIERIKEIADNTKYLKITSAGGIGNYAQLKMLKEVNNPKVDSVMISKALYENNFPCQAIWRDIERMDTSLDLPKVKR
ncbi:MAG: 1-(5-phosphoribosyl)-5-[(5-phosphoribosylamino)methylideneamino]imidazole-4-carboxamide isomerase [Bacteroidetes bacterium]|nr:1-(5-phosphoribosyl)-5-[(5-phosphoribosylamino)methylideneamino]imidazole-4-carboxamide isomerase [Bacteroidota bacterium]